MDSKQAYAELIGRIKERSTLESIGGVLGWDERTYMPAKGSGHRAEQMALLARMAHEMLTSPRIGELLDSVERSSLVKDAQADPSVNVREIRRAYNRAVKMPKELVE